MADYRQDHDERYVDQLHAIWAFEELFTEEQYRIEVLLEGCRERGDADSERFLREQLVKLRLDQENLVRTSLERIHRSLLIG